ncbi:MAG: DUF4234 domain-containing protein [Oscillospiraceae bacterium]|nr:DUF4234 domain-containing protein [Oscillospiraceae bacterium]
MKCDYCGAEVPAGEIFCRNCGTRQMPVPEVEPVLEPAPAVQPVEMEDILQEPPAPEPQIPVREPETEFKPLYVPYGAPERKAPLLQLPTQRSLVKMIFLGLLTLGIYPVVIWSRMVTELNIAASRCDGERTMPYFGACMLAPVTLFIYPLVWMHGFCRRIGAELKRRAIGYEFGASTFWLWNVLGSLILVGPFIFTHKLMKAMNLINRDFNVNG